MLKADDLFWSNWLICFSNINPWWILKKVSLTPRCHLRLFHFLVESSRRPPSKAKKNKMKNKMTFLWDLSSITPLSLTHILTDAVEPWLMWFWLASWIWGWYLHGRGPFLSILCFLKERLKKKVPAPMYQKIIIYISVIFTENPVGHSLKRPHLCDNWNVTLQITLKN